jgi:hypothetical protein
LFEKILDFVKTEIMINKKIEPANVIPNSKLLKKAKDVSTAEITAWV